MAVPGGITPAQLGFLAIYNPSLGRDETIDDQIVYYASVHSGQQHQQAAGGPVPAQAHRRRHRNHGRPTEHLSAEERNERLRQIGLAQGMVDFGSGFSGGQPVDTIETERTRVVVHELEPGWWILASIDLTKLPLPPKLAVANKPGSAADENVEYTSREIKPASLLLQDLLRAHATFLLHHDSSLSSLFVRSRRSRFVSVLGRYWDLFLSTWSVTLHGNPIRAALGGINMAASGELGMGVGEEERGSGEREVLEGLVERTDGLVDLVVSRFGSADDDEVRARLEKEVAPLKPELPPWLGSGREPDAEDGVVFSGLGALSRKSLRDVSHWMEDLYSWGENAYGVIDSPTSTRQTKVKKPETPRPADAPPKKKAFKLSQPPKGNEVGQPKADLQTSKASTTAPAEADTKTQAAGAEQAAEQGEGHMDKLMSYLKLGYGTHWSLGVAGDGGKAGEGGAAAKKDGADAKSKAKAEPKNRESGGFFLIGLVGDVDEQTAGGDGEGGCLDDDAGGDSDCEHNSRTMLRTVHVELEKEARDKPEEEIVRDLGSAANEMASTPGSVDPPTVAAAAGDLNTGSGGGGSGSGRGGGGGGGAVGAVRSFDTHDRNKAKKLRVVVYVYRPFIFAFLFELRTGSLALDVLYRSLHHQVAPLRRMLVASTAYRPAVPGSDGAAASTIYDLVWDPRQLTLHSSIPSIPDPGPVGGLSLAGKQAAWSRAEALGTHVQLLNILAETRADAAQLERTCKTSRGWWVVWARVLERLPLPARKALDEDEEWGGSDGSELTAKEPGGAGSGSGGSTSRSAGTDRGIALGTGAARRPRVSKEIFLVRRASDHAGFRGFSGSSEGVEGPARLAQGIGVDTRRYIEGLLSLNR